MRPHDETRIPNMVHSFPVAWLCPPVPTPSEPKFQTVNDVSHFHTSASCHFCSTRVSLESGNSCASQGPVTALALREAFSGHLESSPLIPNEHLPACITSCLQVCPPICLPAKERALTAQSVLNHGRKYFLRLPYLLYSPLLKSCAHMGN